MTSIADLRQPAAHPPGIRAVLLLVVLALFAVQTPMPWGGLWLMVPATVAVALLAGWRFGGWGVLVPVILLAGSLALGGPGSLWAWWIPAAGLTGVWMGLREEGGGPSAGDRAWMTLPVLLLAAIVPWTMHYAGFIGAVERELRLGDTQFVELARQFGSQGPRLSSIEQAVEEHARMRARILPHVFPTVLFVWNVMLVAAGRSLASWVAGLLHWPALSRARLQSWRLPDGALWMLLLGMAVLVAQWSPGAPSAWTLLLNSGLGYCIQGIAVVESLLLARGVPPSIIVLTMLFVFTVAMPVFMLTTVAVGLSDVWLDYRRLEPRANSDQT